MRSTTHAAIRLVHFTLSARNSAAQRAEIGPVAADVIALVPARAAGR